MSLILATANYAALLNEHNEALPFIEYVKRRGFTLNDKCVHIFYDRIVQLKETDFVEIDRSILETFGYKNHFKMIKKNGIPDVDENGNVKVLDNRNDFANALQALRKMKSYKEGKSLDDITADYVLVPDNAVRGRGAKRHILYVKKRMLEHLCIMSNSPNSHMIREYFLELYRAVNEYMDYQRDYQNMKVLMTQQNLLELKDTKIDQLSVKIDRQSEQIDRQSEQIAELLGYSRDSSKKLTKVMSLVENTKDVVVVPAMDDQLEEIVIVMISEDEKFYCISCVQKRSRKVTIRDNKSKHSDKNLSVLCEIETKPNSKNVWHRFKDYVKIHHLTDQIKMSWTSFLLKENSTISPNDIVSLFNELSRIHQDRVLTLDSVTI